VLLDHKERLDLNDHNEYKVFNDLREISEIHELESTLQNLVEMI
jgi:hypothetical protein